MAALIIVLAGALAYSNSLHGPFIFDDYPTIENNSTIRQLWPISTLLAMAPGTPDPIAARPLANLSFALNYAFVGLHVEGYHATNVAIHLLAALTLFGVLRRTFAVSVPQLHGRPSAVVTAGICALMWVVHPLNSEAVDYLSQRRESMAGLLWLFTLYAAIRAWNGRSSWQWQILAVAACACGIATKESVVTAPIIVVLYDRVFMCESFGKAFERRGGLYAALVGCWLLFLALIWHSPFLRRGSFYSPGGGFGHHVSSWTYLLNQAPMIAHYLRLCVLPFALVLDYGAPGEQTLVDVWPAALFVLTLLVLTTVGLAKFPRIAFWGAWCFITLAPASSVVPIPTEVGAERRMYLPLVSVIVLIALAARAVLQWIVSVSSGTKGVFRTIGWVCTAAVLVGLIMVTRQRNSEYQSAVSIWQTVC